jgi:hypothetical protein
MIGLGDRRTRALSSPQASTRTYNPAEVTGGESEGGVGEGDEEGGGLDTEVGKYADKVQGGRAEGEGEGWARAGAAAPTATTR